MRRVRATMPGLGALPPGLPKICNLPGLAKLCETIYGFANNHLPLEDTDGDGFSAEQVRQARAGPARTNQSLVDGLLAARWPEPLAGCGSGVRLWAARVFGCGWRGCSAVGGSGDYRERAVLQYYGRCLLTASSLPLHR